MIATRQRWLAKPPAGSGIDPAHPLARGLYDFLPFSEGGGPPQNLAAPSRSTSLVTVSGVGPIWTPTAEGVGLGCTGGVGCALPLPAPIGTADFTFRLRFLARSWPGGFSALLDSADREWSMFIGTTGNYSFTGAATAYIGFGSQSLTAGVIHDLTVTRTLSNTTCDTFIDGVLVDPGIYTNDGHVSASTASINFGANPSGGNSPDIVYLSWGWWTRALDPAEVARLWEDPYGLIQRPNARRWFALVSAGAQAIAPAGIGSLESFGTAVLTPGAVAISPAGIASGEAFGTAVVTPGAVAILPAGIGSAEGFGTAVLTPGAVAILPAAIGSAESFGTAVVAQAGTQAILPAGIASGESFGTATVSPGPVAILPAGIASGESFGTAVIAGVPAGLGSFFGSGYFAPTYFPTTYFPGGTGAVIVVGATTLEEAIVTRALGSSALATLIGARFEPHNVPQGGNDEPSLPCVVYRILDDEQDHDLDGAAGIARAIVEFTCYGRLDAQAIDVALALRNLFDGYRGVVGQVRFWFVKLSPQSSDYDEPDDASDYGTHWKKASYKFTYAVPQPTLN